MLKLKGTSILSGSLSALGRCTRLRILDLSFTRASGHLSELAHCQLLEVLHIDGTSISGDISWILHCQQLQVLSASHTPLSVTKKMLAQHSVQKTHPCRLRYLDLSHTELGVGLGLLLDVLSGSVVGVTLEALEHLDLTQCALSGQIKCLKRCPRLREVGLRDNWQLSGELSDWLPQHELQIADVRGTRVLDQGFVSNATISVDEFRGGVKHAHDEEGDCEEKVSIPEKSAKVPPPLPPPPQEYRVRVRTI